MAVAADPEAKQAALVAEHIKKQDVLITTALIPGRPAPQLISAMQAFRSGQRPATVMDRIAKGFTDDEIRAIAAWYAAQKD